MNEPATLRILLIEDDPDDALIIARLLKESRLDCELTIVPNLTDAVLKGKEQDWDVLLADLSLPDSKGPDTIHQLQVDFSHLPLVVLTGLDDEQTAHNSIRHGAQDYLVKGKIDSAGLERSITFAIERKHMQTAVQDAKKWEAVSRLAGGVAHEFNNLLTTIMGLSQMIAEDPESAEQTQADAQEILDAGNRASALTQQLLTFNRKHTTHTRTIDFNVFLRGILPQVQEWLGFSNKLILDVEPGLWTIDGNPNQLEDVIRNLVMNAMEAMPDGGSIRLSARNVTLPSAQLDFPEITEEGDYVLISFADDGAGMTREVQEMAIEPFYTTKQHRDGLGLTTVYGIINNLGGAVSLVSQPGEGTTVNVLLPKGDIFYTDEPETEQWVMPVHSKTILVVDDEKSLLRVVDRILSKAGYQVITAESGEEAVHLAKTYAQPIHLLLSDVLMGGMDGPTAAKRILEETERDLKVMFMTGYSDGRLAEFAKDFPGAPLISKPFTGNALMHQVMALLNKP